MSVGFGSSIDSKTEQTTGEYFSKVEPQDLLKFGLIPEFIGRLPIVVALNNLDKEALINILTKPKNAIIKQYKALCGYDGADLEFTPEALDAIADKAIKRATGARGLRAIIEEIMGDVMFSAPSDKTIEKIVVTKEAVEKTAPVTIVRKTERKKTGTEG